MILQKKKEKYISIPANFLNIDPSYHTETTIHKKIIRVKITQKTQNKK